jgi:hypothetical protein
MTIRQMDQIENFNSEFSFKPIKSWYQLERLLEKDIIIL